MTATSRNHRRISHARAFSEAVRNGFPKARLSWHSPVKAKRRRWLRSWASIRHATNQWPPLFPRVGFKPDTCIGGLLQTIRTFVTWLAVKLGTVSIWTYLE